jgi:hypothetical protein
MTSLTFWLHMDQDYMWRWHCFDDNKAHLAFSDRCYFSYEEAVDAVLKAKKRMILAAAT